MHYNARTGRRVIFRQWKWTMAAAGAVAMASPAMGQVTLTKTSNTNWAITNGDLNVTFDPSAEDITSIKLAGSNTNLLGGSSPELDEETAGTGFGPGTQTFSSQIGPNNSYVDVWTTVAEQTTEATINPITYAFHYVLFANDPTIQVYETLSHASTDPAASVGQGQFLFRSNPSLFPNLYQAGLGPNDPNPQTTIGVPSTASNFSSITGQAGRTVSNVTYDLTGSGLAGDNGTNFFTKYDYSTYTQFFQAETMYGSQFAVSEAIPSDETLTGGPTKQELAWTDPGILNLEFLSDHYGIDGSGSGAYPGYAYDPPQGVASTHLFGAYDFYIQPAVQGGVTLTAAQLNQNAINEIPTSLAEDNTDAELIASGYVPTNTDQRGNVQVTAASSAGWSSNTVSNTVVLSEPGVNMQESTQGDQYWAQLGVNGTATIPNVVPGTYRMTLYQLGQWGETRIDGVQVQAGQVSIPQNVTFTPENFGESIWTIGTPNRSDNEFLNGSYTSGPNTGQDLRQFYGAFNYWQEIENISGNTLGFITYNATATTVNGTAVAATNNTQDWPNIMWGTFDPSLYYNGSSNGYSTAGSPEAAPAYVLNSTGGPAAYRGSAWVVNFNVTQQQLSAQNYNYVVMSIAAGALNASLVVTLNGHSETWSYNNFSPDDPAARSGDAGFYQWAAIQFPIADLNAAGVNDTITFGVSNHAYGIMWDALRMELSVNGANPAVTGWYDYTYVTSGNTAPVDSTGLAAQNSFAAIPEPTMLGMLACGGLLLRRTRRQKT